MSGILLAHIARIFSQSELAEDMRSIPGIQVKCASVSTKTLLNPGMKYYLEYTWIESIAWRIGISITGFE